MLHSQVNIENHSIDFFTVTHMSREIAGRREKDLFEMYLINWMTHKFTKNMNLSFI